MPNGPSVGEQLVQAMCDALNAPADKPCRAYRTRVDAMAANELPAMVVFAAKETPARKSPSRYLRRRRVLLEVMVAGEPPADRKTDPIYVYAVNTLLADQNLGQYLRGLEEASAEWQTAPSYDDVSVAQIEFEAIFVTTSDPSERVDE